uniref:Putative ovule protein n=1 Tax=Solanum chacoense TaxID=4108 RepID=A0A0V0H220_SOLCH
MFFSKSTSIMNTCFVHEPSKFCLRKIELKTRCDWDASSQEIKRKKVMQVTGIRTDCLEHISV